MRQASILFLLAVLTTTGVQAQRLMTRNGHVWFHSHTPVEDIEAHNYQTTSIIDPATGNLAFVLLMAGFQFEKALMQTHFNEKYVESDKFPKATFDGKITNTSDIDFAVNGTYAAKVKGTLTIHGVGKEIETSGKITVLDGQVSATATFPINLADHDIAVPGIARNKVAEVVNAHVDIKYGPQGN